MSRPRPFTFFRTWSSGSADSSGVKTPTFMAFLRFLGAISDHKRGQRNGAGEQEFPNPDRFAKPAGRGYPLRHGPAPIRAFAVLPGPPRHRRGRVALPV